MRSDRPTAEQVLGEREKPAQFHLSSAKLFSRSLAIWARNFVPFTLLGTVLLSPAFVLMMLLPTRAGHLSRHDLIGLAFCARLLAFLLGYVLTGALAHGVVQQLRGKRVRTADCLLQGLRRSPALLGTSALVGMRVLQASLLLVVPGIIEACRLWLAVPVSVMERSSLSTSVQRSIALTEGSRWAIFSVWSTILVASLAAEFAIDAVGATAHAVLPMLGLQCAVLVVEHIATATASAVCYCLLRQGKENVEVEELAAVFA